MDCSICFDSFNRGKRTPSTCPACSVQICRTCIQTYLLQDDGNDPKCASCKVPWTHTFLYSTLTSAFRTGAYKQHREKVLYDREKARLPDTQEDAQRYKTAKTMLEPLRKERQTIRTEMEAVPAIAAHNEAIRKFNAEEKSYSQGKTWEQRRAWWSSAERIKKIHENENLRKKARPFQKPFLARLATVEEAMITPRYIVDSHGLLPHNYEGGPAEAKVKRSFIMKCPQETCEGFLSQAYKCGMCEIQVCAHCHVTKTSDDHVCDQALVETIKQIKKEARPCPKCASLISKIDGCDQMWCTQCNTAFSWNTGQIEERVIHNPHYFAYLRATGQHIPRAPGDVPGPCAELNLLYDTMNALRRKYVKATLVLDTFQREALHIQQVTLHGYRHELRNLTGEQHNRNLRVERLTNEITDDDWKYSLQKREKATYKVQAWIQLLEMYATSTLETLARLKPDATEEDLYSIKTQLETLKAYVMTEANAIAKLYSCVMPRELRPPPVLTHVH